MRSLVLLAFLAHAAVAQVAIDHVTIVDVRDGSLAPNQTVLIDRGRIISVEKSGNAALPAGARVVDGRRQFLIPGLWDMHDHSAEDGDLSRQVLLPLLVANGVTGAREMFGSRAVLAVRDDVRRGVQIGPRMIVGSPIIDGPRPMWPGSVSVATEAEGRHVVDSLVSEGYDFIKTYQFLSSDAYRGIADEARQRGVAFAGHVPFTISAADASDLGQRTIEHEIGISLACSTRESEIRQSLVAAAASIPAAFPPHAALLGRGEDEPISTFDSAKCGGLFARFVRNDTWVVPTLIAHRVHARGRTRATRDDPRLRYLPASLRAEWEATVMNRPPPVDAAFQRVDPNGLRLALAMQKAGVSMLVGTDAMNAFVIPGFAVHDELALLVEAGLTPLEALRAATIAPAAFLHASDSLGVIAPGRLADLVLLDGNPLSNISNTRRIHAVVLAGVVYDRGALDALLAGAAKAAAKR